VKNYYPVILITIAFGMFVIAAFDYAGLSKGTCGAMADHLVVNCWGTRLLRSVTGWPTNISAAVGDCVYGVLALLLGILGWHNDE